jgi:RNA polymerase sigma-70 factor (family 1)
LPLIVKHIKLFELVGKGDETAFREIFHYYTPRLNPFIFKIVKSGPVAEGIVQDVFIKLWLHREQVAQKDDPSSWLFTVAANLAFNYLKKVSTQQRYIEYIKSAIAESNDMPEAEHLLISKDNHAALHTAVEKLPPQRQRIFKLSRMEGLSYKEIAEKLDISPFTVKNQLVAALDYIRKYLKKTDAFFIISLYTLPYFSF